MSHNVLSVSEVAESDLDEGASHLNQIHDVIRRATFLTIIASGTEQFRIGFAFVFSINLPVFIFGHLK